MKSSFVRAAVSAAVGIVIGVGAACSSSTDPGSGSTDLSLESGRDAATIANGAPVTFDITVARVSGYADTVTLEAENLPAGLSATFAPSSLFGEESKSVLTLTVTGHVDAGTAVMIVRASGKGVEPATRAINLTIIDPASSGFTMTATPAAVTVPRGTSGNVSIDLARVGGFEGAVLVNALGLPPNVTATFTPEIVTGSSSVLTLSVGPTVPVTTYLFTVTGSASGVAAQSMTITLLVAPASAGVQR